MRETAPNSVPRNAQEALGEGQELLSLACPDYSAAERKFRLAVGLAPTWAEAHHWLSCALGNQGLLEEACACEREAIRLQPGDVRAYLGLGRYLIMLHRHGEAAPLLKTAIEMGLPYSLADAKLLLAECYENLQQISEAGALWKDIAEMEASYPSYSKPMQEAIAKLVFYGLRTSSDC
jgi:tetratricopeptide (TPR) repeat protein